MKVKKIAVIGGGNGAITAAADLTERGFEVTLFELEQYRSRLDIFQKNGGIVLAETGEGERFVPYHGIVDTAQEAVKDAQLIMFMVPGFAIQAFAKEIIPWLQDGQVIFFNGAAALSCLRFSNELKREGNSKKLYLCESNSLSYGTRVVYEEGKAVLSLRVKKLFLASYPSKDIDLCFETVSQIYDCFVKAENIWQTTLENGNPEVHPGPCLLNVGRIDYSKGEFWLYKEGITEHTIRLLHAIEKERMEIGKALGFTLENATESRYRRGYLDRQDEDLQTLFNESPVFSQIKGPVSVESRYFTEDISEGLVLWSDLGRVSGVATPNIDAVIVLGSTILKTNFYETGLTLRSVGLSGVTKEELLNI